MSSAKASQVIARQLSERTPHRNASSKVEITGMGRSPKKLNFAFAMQCSFNAYYMVTAC